MKQLYFLLFFFCASLGQAQKIDTKHITYPNALQSLHTLKEVLAIPNDANHSEDIEKNVSWCEAKLKPAGFTTKRLATATLPLLLAVNQPMKKGKPTMLFYFHIDGQPVDPSFWFQDNPYEAVLKEEVEGEGWIARDWNRLQEKTLNPEWRIFARSSSDDKSPFVMFLTALETLKQQGKTLPYNLKIILDFEEEKGSPNLAKAVAANKEALAADMLLIFDGPKHPSNQPTISYGARGITTLSVKVFGPTFPLHSGHYGNYAPNPALRLSQLLSGMKDAYGRVTIPGYYDGIYLDADTKAILATVPDNEKALRGKLGIGEIDSVGSNYQEAIQYPCLLYTSPSPRDRTRSRMPSSA